jgi:hypothetical protein
MDDDMRAVAALAIMSRLYHGLDSAAIQAHEDRFGVHRASYDGWSLASSSRLDGVMASGVREVWRSANREYGPQTVEVTVSARVAGVLEATCRVYPTDEAELKRRAPLPISYYKTHLEAYLDESFVPDEPAPPRCWVMFVDDEDDDADLCPVGRAWARALRGVCADPAVRHLDFVTLFG